MTDYRVKQVAFTTTDKTIVFKDGTSLKPYVEGEIEIGEHTFLSPVLEIGQPHKPLASFSVGSSCTIFAGQIMSRHFVCGDYVTIHEGVWAYGKHDIVIGHNSWFGRRCTLDAEGGFRVGNGFGAGQDTHMWSHIRHGDVLAGNRFLSYGSFEAEDDVWLVGRCTSAPAHHEARSMAMAESNLTKGMGANTLWGGNPAQDLTAKLGAPFLDTGPTERAERFMKLVDEFAAANSDIDRHVVMFTADNFNEDTRQYHKTSSLTERRFMRFLLPEAKFVPDARPIVSL